MPGTDAAERPRVMIDHVSLPGLETALLSHAELVSWTQQPQNSYSDVAGIFTSGQPRVDGSMMDRLPRLRVISNFGVGVDHIDCAGAAERGIAVGNTPGVLDAATADLAWTLLLAAARRLKETMRHYQTWLPARPGGRRDTEPSATDSAGSKPAVPLGTDLAGKTLGILGMGRIGTQVARRANGFDMQVIYHNRRPVDPGQLKRTVPIAATYVELNALWEQSDFLVITVPLTDQTRGLVGADALSRLKATATLINIARGPIVDTQALVDALQAGRLAAAALDVTDPEPLPEHHPLRLMPNVIITSHIGSATHETRWAMAELAVENLSLGLAGKPLRYDVTQIPPGASERAEGI